MRMTEKVGGLTAIAVILFLLIGMVGFCSDIDAVVFVGKGESSLTSIASKANKVVNNVKIVSYDTSTGNFFFSNSKYVSLKVEEKEEFMKVILTSIRDSSMASKSKSKVFNFVANQDSEVTSALKYLKVDISADFVSASAWFRPFNGVIGTVLGVLTLIIFTFLSISVIFDVAYIALPMFQLLMSRGRDDEKPLLVSRECYQTVRDVEQSSEYRSAMSIYMQRKTPLIFLVALCIAYLISGKIYDFIGFVIDVFNTI